jgi:hypothetical protein
MKSGDQEPGTPDTSGTPEIKARAGERSPVAGTYRSGKIVVLVFVFAAAGLIGGSAGLLRWAKNKSRESLVHPPGVTSAPALSASPASPAASPAPQNPPKP